MESENRYLFGEIRDLPEDVEKTRTIEFPISTESKDRHGTVLNQNNWKLDNFNRNGIVGYQHNVYGANLCSAPDPDDVIGVGEAFMREGVLWGRVRFEPAENNPQAEKIFRKILHGTLKATSVGFLPLYNDKGEEGQYGRMNENGEVIDKDTFFYFGQELLEFSIVNIPSNPEAVRKSIRNQSANALTYVYRALGGKYRISQIENLRVREIMDMIDGKEVEPRNLEEEIKQLQTQIKSLQLDKKVMKSLRG